ncbi:rhamnulokinase [Paenibacillus sp. B2(2019)]|uniref:rhamnulokinase n=1 Tax=Paenibacillus sp. B2(2019) TaxID=2607754 RepID=UPI0011F0E0B1|nr:rhamnulokinase family protein [Paenibacillus sp. B2(2019)]KAA1177586.1 rhamnulokinase [Paenibacillus sp. B2(2019)]
MGDTIKLLAIDLGASSGRVMLGIYDGDKLQMEEIHRFENTPVQVNGHLYWDTLRLFHEMKQGVQKAFRQHGELTSLSVDTWGVDYGFIDKRGMMLYSPHHYRDRRMEAHLLKLEALLSPAEQFRMTGLQPSVINTLYQLFSDFQDNDSLMETADTILMMPDLFHYLFSGIKAAESTIWSTSGLVDAVTGELSSELFNRLGIPSSLVPQQVHAGTVIGSILPIIQEELNIGPMKVIAGASHDTASAVASIPYIRKDEAAFLSCGTWSLVGMETPEPVISEKSYEYGFTNERCYGNSNRLLKNTTGLWILQELQRNWAKAGENFSQSEMVELAQTINGAPAIIDPNDQLFSTPGVMMQRIQEYCERTGQQSPNTKAEFIRVILESLAQSYCRTIEEMEEITGKTITIIHMVGGGIQNELLCQLTADATGREVVAGPVEASGIGNIIVQLAALGKLEVSKAKEFVARSFTFKTYQPSLVKNSKK